MNIMYPIHIIHRTVFPALNRLSFLAVFGLRLWIANIFWASGMLKLQDWQGTIALFADEYRVPVLSPEIAATLGTAVELSAPVLVAVGLGARFGAVGLLCMTAVIEFTYMHFDAHVIWALVLALIILQGPGLLSVDHLIRRYIEKNNTQQP